MKKNKNAGLPLLNQTADSNFNSKDITYAEIGNVDYGALQVYSSNNSIYLAGLSREKKKKVKGIWVAIIEIRSEIPMVAFYFKLNNDPKYIIQPRDIVTATLDVELYFPIDEEDEEDAKELCWQIVTHLDLTKLKELK